MPLELSEESQIDRGVEDMLLAIYKKWDGRSGSIWCPPRTMAKNVPNFCCPSKGCQEVLETVGGSTWVITHHFFIGVY